MLTQLRKRSQITIPKEIIKKLGLKEGDSLNIVVKNSKIIIEPVVPVPKDQAWFWSPEWQKNEKEADEDIKAGRVKSFDSVEELIEDLNA
ncbi:hypothetical protein H0A61_00244 [Koleobacter methoxysyntrophicus]|jgi:AbrB family looped-hinge helix DNA binding protein|uniref:SpoVT-AbrB domain-containing protein n=1 Tax=Koleobacter methoxysyntrophicus TaxID=2751313 RepID=A0A8A0RI34_9FIRM|nr:AbrB/MazE/SpoVT family DNA-binding domain-containing protein [Koleobacter methoxysyntrophicus]QSQ07925.1 hypothetical protein H0A61_00244 [Koleobacter methoxysyntrophicus]